MKRVSYSRIFREAAIYHLWDGDSRVWSYNRVKSQFSCHAIEDALSYIRKENVWRNNPARDYAERFLMDVSPLVRIEELFDPDDDAQSIRFMWLLFLAEETRNKKLYIEIEETEDGPAL